MDIYDSSPKRNQKDDSGGGKPFIGIFFECCQVYQRIYKDKSGRFYAGNCPQCGKRVVIPVGKGGSSSRFFGVR